METNLEGVGVGKGNLEISWHADSSRGDDDKSQETREEVGGPVEGMGCGASSDTKSGVNRPANCKGTTSKTSTSSIKYGPNLLEVNIGASHLESPKEKDASQRAHSVGKWKRIRRDKGVVSDSLGKEASAGKRNSLDQESDQRRTNKRVKENLVLVDGEFLHTDDVGSENAHTQGMGSKSGVLAAVDFNVSDRMDNRLGVEIPTMGRQVSGVKFVDYSVGGDLDVGRI
ncbi:hypothetical protein Q3G72_001603 [Acer saccharum]|nr:hypothetical protein Q3G72_001603 [Acer saccharum]